MNHKDSIVSTSERNTHFYLPLETNYFHASC